jgi:hypothetical protein
MRMLTSYGRLIWKTARPQQQQAQNLVAFTA